MPIDPYVLYHQFASTKQQSGDLVRMFNAKFQKAYSKMIPPSNVNQDVALQVYFGALNPLIFAFARKEGNIITLAEAYAEDVKVEQFSPWPLVVNPLSSTLLAMLLVRATSLQSVNGFTMPSLPMLSYYSQLQIIVASTTNALAIPPIIFAMPSLSLATNSNPRSSFLPDVTPEASTGRL